MCKPEVMGVAPLWVGLKAFRAPGMAPDRFTFRNRNYGFREVRVPPSFWHPHGR